MAPCYSLSAVQDALPETPPSLHLDTPLLPALPPLQACILRDMEAIARWDTTIAAMCLRRTQLHSQLMSQLLCMYEILASHTATGSLSMQGSGPQQTVFTTEADVGAERDAPAASCSTEPPTHAVRLVCPRDEAHSVTEARTDLFVVDAALPGTVEAIPSPIDFAEIVPDLMARLERGIREGARLDRRELSPIPSTQCYAQADVDLLSQQAGSSILDGSLLAGPTARQVDAALAQDKTSSPSTPSSVRFAACVAIAKSRGLDDLALGTGTRASMADASAQTGGVLSVQVTPIPSVVQIATSPMIDQDATPTFARGIGVGIGTGLGPNNPLQVVVPLTTLAL